MRSGCGCSKHYRVLSVLMLLSVAMFMGACSKGNEAVATVNGETISKDELYDVLVKQGGPQALDALIMKKIIDMEAVKQDVSVSQEGIDAEIEEMAEQYGGMETFNQIMNMYGYEIDDIKEDVKMNLKVEGLLKPRIIISEEEMAEYFEENKETFDIEEQVTASHILTETESDAAKVKEKIDAGDDFVMLAKEYSIDEGTKDFGGDLGIVKRGEMVAEFEDAAFSLEAGEISLPIKTQFGYHIIKIEDKKNAQEADYEQSKGSIEKMIFNSKVQSEISVWYQEKLDEYKIEKFIE